jgi:hypothetical protein
MQRRQRSVEVDKHSWRGFSHDALVDSVSSDLARSGWLNDPSIPCDEPSAYVQFAGNVLLKTLFKKWESNTERAESQALLTFLEANYLSERWTRPSEFDFSGTHTEFWGNLKWELDKFLHPEGLPLVTSYNDLWENGYTGPGASIGASGTSRYAKLGCSKLSVTSEDLYMSYLRYVSCNPLAADAECIRADHYGALNVVDKSNVSFAPKNADTARLICTEPSLNMYAQLGLKVILDKRMKQVWGVDMEDQPEMNRFLARLGSRDGAFGTLDLSSASDRISVSLCREVLPEWFFNLLMDLRCPAANVKDYGLCVDLGMISTMGNGFTFPVMTIILSCAVRAAYKTLRIPIEDLRRVTDRREVLINRTCNSYNIHANWAVFGDDIIVRREAYDYVVSVLSLLGMSVNTTKSFNTGPFRESCGHDYFHGLNVRGVYLKRLTSLQDLAVAVNLLVQWTAQTGIGLPEGCSYLMSLIRDDQMFYVPYASPLESGIRVPRALLPDFVKTTRKGSDWRYKTCFKAWTVVPVRVKFGDGVVLTPSGYRRLGYNAPAALISFLLGEVRDGAINIRQNTVSVYRTQWHVTHSWDYVPPSYWFNHQHDWQRFFGAVYENLKLS